MRLALLFIEFYPNAGGLLCAPRPRDPSAFSAPLRPTAPKLASVVPALRLFLSESLRLDPPTFSCFTAVDWGRLILAIILSFRLSLHVPECPAFDHVAARADIRLDTFLDTMCREPDCLVPAANKIDVLSASRVVMRVVKAKLDRRLELDSMREVARGSCPMLDGSLDQFFPLWDVGLATLNTTTGPTEMGAAAGGGKQPVFHDLWATMTMGWANEDDEGGT